MEKDKFLNKYTKSIIEGLGYEILPKENNSERPIIVKKETKEPLPVEETRFSIWSPEELETEYVRMQDDPGMLTYIFKDLENNLDIYLYEYSGAELYITDPKNNNQKIIIKIDYQRFEEAMNITIEDKKTNKSVQFMYYGIDYNERSWKYYYRSEIKISNVKNRETIIHLSPNNDLKWGDFKNPYPITKYSFKNVSTYLIKKIKEYKDGEYWTQGIRKGIDVIAPALAIYIVDFKKDWQTFLEGYRQFEIERQNEKQKQIGYIQEEIQKSKNTNKSITKALKQLEAIPEQRLIKK